MSVCQVMSFIQKLHRPSPEARELYGLLSSAHLQVSLSPSNSPVSPHLLCSHTWTPPQALLSSHDSVAQADYSPILAPLPDELPEDEEAMRIVCLVKNNQPLVRSSAPNTLTITQVHGSAAFTCGGLTTMNLIKQRAFIDQPDQIVSLINSQIL